MGLLSSFLGVSWYGAQITDVVVFCAGNDIWSGLDAKGLENLGTQMCNLQAHCTAKGQRVFFVDVVPSADENWDLLHGR